VIPIVLVLGSEAFAERCRAVVGDRGLVVGREPADGRVAATTWLPRVIVIPTDDYSADPAEVEAAVRRVRARLVKVLAEDIAQTELEDLLGAALVSSGVRVKA
jgi:hypothetical protein